MITFRNYLLQNYFAYFQFSENYFVLFGQNLKPWWDWGTQQCPARVSFGQSRSEK